MASSTKAGIIGAVIGVAITVGGVLVYNSIKTDKQVKIETQVSSTIAKNDSEKTNASPVQKTNSVTAKDTVASTKSQPMSPVVKDTESKVETKISEKKETVAVPMAPVVKKTIKPSAVDRVFPKVMKGNFSMIGRGEDAKWGIGRVANFQYSIFILADSEIISKKALKNGTIKVVEKRTFNRVQDSVVVSDVDFRLALDTLPIATFSKMIDGVAVGYTSLTGDAATGAAVVTGKNYLVEKLRSVDGISARKLLGFIGFKPTPDIDAALNKLATSQLTKALGVVRSISGKSYIVTYYQEKNGQPLMVTFKNADGSEVTDDEEKMILKRVNAFIDYNVVPDGDCRPGDHWSIAAEDMQEVFDPFVDGTYTGKVTATRRSNAENGDWTVEMSPSAINVIADNGTTTGSLQLNRGKAMINPEKLSVNEMFVAGKAKLTKTSRHHLLFTARIDGLCDFQGRIVTTAKEK